MAAASTDPSPPAAAPRQAAGTRWIDRWGRPALAIYWLTWLGASYLGQQHLTPPQLGFFHTDKIAHGLGMAGLTALLIAARPLGRRASFRATAIAGGLIGAGYAMLDEAVQYWVPTRDASLTDVTANLIGVLGVYVIAAADHPVRRGVCYSVRAVAAVLLPTLAYFALAPGVSAMVAPWFRRIGLALGDADATLHLLSAAVLTWLLAGAALAGRHRPRISAALAVVLVVLVGPVLEHAQMLTGRGARIDDVVEHMRGVLLALGVWTVFSMARAMVLAAPTARAALAASGTATTATTAATATTATGGETRDQSAGSRFVGHAVRVSALTLVSRVTGLVRDATLAAVFGLGAVADAFFIGFLVPNLFRRLFGEGALASSFIPHYTDLLKRDRELAQRFASLCLVLLSLVLAVIVIVAEVVLGAVSAVSAGEWSESTSLALRLTMVMLPYMPLVCAVAMIGGVLQVHGRFAVTAAAPVVLNVLVVVAAALAAFGPRPAETLEAAAFWVAAAVVVAGAGQLVWQLVALRGVARLTWRFDGAGPSLRSMLVMMGPMVAALAVFQINALFDSVIAFALSPRNDAETFRLLGFTLPYPIEVGSVAALQWAQRLYQFPLGVFGIALATAIFPALAHAAAAAGRGRGSDDDEFAAILRQGLRLSMFIALPAAVGLMLVRLPLTTVIYQRGAFGADDAQRVATILTGYAASVWAYALVHVLMRAFYARKDAATPLRVSMAMVGLNLCLNVVLIWPLGAAGLAWSTAITGAGQAIALLVLARRRVGRPMDRTVWLGWARTAMLTLAMAAVLAALLAWLGPWADTPWGATGVLAIMVSVGAAIVLIGAWATGAEELRWLVRRRVADV